jgi:O-antigen/teichoic acid export membrane protein
MGRVATGTVLGGAIALAGAILVGLTLQSAVAAVAAFAVAEAAASLFFWTAARGRRPVLGLGGALRLLRPAAPIAVSTLAVYAFYANVDTIILGAVRSTAEAGYYSAAYRVFLALNIVAVFAAYAFYPLVSRDQGVRSPERLARRLEPALLAVAAYGAAVLACAELVGRPVLELLFGSAFGRADDVLVLLCLSTAWYGVGYVFGYNLIAIGRQGRFSAGAATAGVLGLALDGVLIPAFGMEGAAVATTAAIIVGTLIWLGPDASRSRAVWPILAALAALTAAGAAAVAVDELAPPAAAAGAVAAGVLAHRSLRLRRIVGS